jgi:hypothetical protein
VTEQPTLPGVTAERVLVHAIRVEPVIELACRQDWGDHDTWTKYLGDVTCPDCMTELLRLRELDRDARRARRAAKATA